MMPKGKEAKGTKVTLKTAKKAIRITLDGKRRLTLSNMGITVFPKCLFKVTNVDELDLSRNLIRKLPDNIDKLSSITWLDLHSNKLESVPESIGNIVGLTHLNLANNCLTRAGLPSSLGSLTNLKSLNLGLNQLDSLPSTLEHLSSLKELGLFDNRFIKQPEFLKVLCNLTKVNVKRNPFTYCQDGGDTLKKEKPELKQHRLLVQESSLCRTCQSVAQREGLTGDRKRYCAGDAFQKKKERNYSGLMTPNSVAKVNQDVWRIKGERCNTKKASTIPASPDHSHLTQIPQNSSKQRNVKAVLQSLK